MLRLRMDWGVPNLNVIIGMEDVRCWPGESPDGVRGQDLGVRGQMLVTTDMQR